MASVVFSYSIDLSASSGNRIVLTIKAAVGVEGSPASRGVTLSGFLLGIIVPPILNNDGLNIGFGGTGVLRPDAKLFRLRMLDDD
jgi:hypothetical protein